MSNGKYNPEVLREGDVIIASPVGVGKITGVSERGYPQVNHVTVAWCVREDGAQYDPHMHRSGSHIGEIGWTENKDAIEFKREDRYLVLKYKDLATLPRPVSFLLDCWLESNRPKLPSRQYVVIESDWPEYEVAYKLIEARVTGKSSEIEDLRKILAAVEHERDALQAKLTALEGQEPVAGSVTVGNDYKNCIEITHCESDAIAQYEASTEGGFESLYTLHKLYAAAGAAPTLSKDQTAAINIVLAHYEGDARIEPLRALLPVVAHYEEQPDGTVIPVDPSEMLAGATPVPAGKVLVPVRMTAAMQSVFEQDDWEWADVLVAANAVTESQYEEALDGAAPVPEGWQEFLRDLTQHVSESQDHTPKSFDAGLVRLANRAHRLLAAAPKEQK